MIYPKISVVTPNFNQVNYLEETILSILNQGYPNLEYIIIDGGSTDGSVDIIKKYQKQLSYWVSEPDNGMYEAIQKGFDKSTGEIMAWINSDDMYYSKSFFTIGEIFSTLSDVNWLVGVSTLYDTIGRSLYAAPSRQFNKFDFYSYDYRWIQQESCFWRRSLWNKVDASLNTKLKYAGDLDLWLRFFRHETLYTIDALIGGYRIRGTNQLSYDHFDDYIEEANKQINEEIISDKDKIILKRYLILRRINRMISKFKFINIDKLLDYFKKSYFPPIRIIKYDFDNQKFNLHKIN